MTKDASEVIYNIVKATAVEKLQETLQSAIKDSTHADSAKTALTMLKSQTSKKAEILKSRINEITEAEYVITPEATKTVSEDGFEVTSVSPTASSQAQGCVTF